MHFNASLDHGSISQALDWIPVKLGVIILVSLLYSICSKILLIALRHENTFHPLLSYIVTKISRHYPPYKLKQHYALSLHTDLVDNVLVYTHFIVVARCADVPNLVNSHFNTKDKYNIEVHEEEHQPVSVLIDVHEK